jgi:hypothetical protein
MSAKMSNHCLEELQNKMHDAQVSSLFTVFYLQLRTWAAFLATKFE